jgi:hypothetical protein
MRKTSPSGRPAAAGGGAVEERHAALRVGRNHPVADAAEHHAQPFALAPQALLDAQPLDADGDLVRDRRHRAERRVRQGAAREHRQHAHQPVGDDQRIPGEGDQPFGSRPVLRGDARIANHRVGQVRSPLLGDLPDLVTADRDSRVRAVGVRVPPGAGLQLQHVPRLAHRPDARERAVEVPHGGLGAAREHLLQGLFLGERPADVAAVLGQPHLFGDRRLGAPADGDVGERDDRPDHRSTLPDRVRSVFRGERRAVRPPEVLVIDVCPLATAERLVDPAVLLVVGRAVGPAVVDQLVHVPPQQVLGPRVAEQAQAGRVAEGAAAPGVDAVDRLARRFQEQPRALLAGPGAAARVEEQHRQRGESRR